MQPRAKVTAIDGKIGEAYKLRLAAPPVDGKANAECERFLARVLKAPVRIVHGHAGRIKLIEADGIDAAEVERRLLG
ncbi:MAG: DUF167 domain-containing protein [Bryobacteraceae bacterium]